MSAVKVTVVLPVYKVEPWLPACLDSVLGQTLREIEVIAIDDASPDNCGAILDRYAREDARLKVIHLEKNRRQGYGRDLGLAEAAGKYVYFLDSDDMITPEALEELYKTAEADDLDGIFFDSQVLFESEKLQRKAVYQAERHGSYPDDVTYGETLFAAFVRQREWTCYVQRQFWRTEFLRENGIDFPDKCEHEDELFAFKAILAAKRVRYVPDRYFIRRYREDSVMTRPASARDFGGYFIIYLEELRFIRDHCIALPEVHTDMARIYEKCERFYRLLPDKEELRAQLRTEDELRFFEFFEETQKSGLYAEGLTEKLAEKLQPRVCIYGAGIIGRNVFKGLSDRGFLIEAVLVSDHRGNPETLFGRPVLTPKEAEPLKETTTAVIAMGEGHRTQIEEILDKEGWHHIFYTGEEP